MQFCMPSSARYFPCSQTLQSASSSWLILTEAPTELSFHVPLGHLLHAVEPWLAWYSPIPHSLHEACPTWLLNIPVSQRVHLLEEEWSALLEPLSARDLPVGQSEQDRPLLLVSEYFPAPHTVHSLNDLKPDAVDRAYVPGGHKSQSFDPSSSWYLPAGQKTQSFIWSCWSGLPALG